MLNVVFTALLDISLALTRNLFRHGGIYPPAPSAVGVERPSHVLPNQFRLIIATRLERGDDLSAARCVPQCYGYVAQPAFEANATDRRASEPYRHG